MHNAFIVYVCIYCLTPFFLLRLYTSTKEIDKVMKGLPSYREDGLNRENFVDVVPLL